MDNEQTAPAESSTAVAPQDPKAYADWRMTGKMPTDKPVKKEEPKEAEAAAAQESEKGAPASEAGKEAQEKKAKPRSDAAMRLEEILADLKQAGLTPAELKSFKREAQRATAEPKGTPETTEKPAGVQAPKKPKEDDFETYVEFEAAKEKYHEDNAVYQAQKAVKDFQLKQATEASQKDLTGKLAEAKTRYGAESEKTILGTADTILQDPKIPGAIKSMINDSPVLVDLMYVMGTGDHGDLAEFIGLAKSNPGAAVRKMVLLERLVMEELEKGTSKGKAEGEGEETGGEVNETPQRDASGKFIGGKPPPEKKVTAAPPIGREVSGRGAAAPNEIESAAKANDFRRFKDASNRRDLARRKGL